MMSFRILVGWLCWALAGLMLAGCAGQGSAAPLNSSSRPSMTTQPSSQTVTAGLRASFTVVATGTVPLSYQWEKNGTNIAGATLSTYTTPPTTSSDNGAQFVVVVSNIAGSVTSGAVTLTVNSPPLITTQPSSQTVTAGQRASFTVVATGTVPLSYQWEKNGTNIAGATSSSYTTPPTTSSDNGAQFVVVVSNIAGSVTGSAATLTVNPPLSLHIVSASLPDGQIQAAYSFTVQAAGGIPPYIWSVVGAQLPSGLNLSHSNGTISGIPTLAGAFTFTLHVSDSVMGAASSGFTFNIAPLPPPPTAPFGHVFLVVEENHNYADVVGNSSMPYLNSLIKQSGLATQYYANTHPSIGNYFMLTTGQTLTNNDSKTPRDFPVSADNVVRELVAAGKTWKTYAEDLPSVGYTGGDNGNYYVRHNPLAYMMDVQNSPTQVQNLVPFTQFSQDVASGNLPNYSFIVPNACDDAHNCALAVADNWLKTNIAPLIQSPMFQKDGLLIIAFDESASDNTDGGGRVAVVLISAPFSKPDFQSTILFHHESVLRLMLEGLGVTVLPGATSTAPTMWDFFTF
jgi:hypothetical protein